MKSYKNLGLVLFIGLVTLLLQGCLTHWVIETETRLQIDNRTPYSLANLTVVDPKGNAPEISWIQDTVPAGERSMVKSQELVGKFSFVISAKDSACGEGFCWRTIPLGLIHVGGGSVVWRIQEFDGRLEVEVK